MMLPSLVEVHVGSGFGGRLLAIVEEVHLAIGAAKEQESAAAEIAGLGKNDRQRETHGHGGVHGIAALLQDGHASLGSVGLQSHHHAMPGVDGTGRVAERRKGAGDGEDEGEQAAERVHGRNELRG